MPDRISKVQRWLDLISFLVGRRFPVDVDEVLEPDGVRRKVRERVEEIG